jgi:hypothetical protein
LVKKKEGYVSICKVAVLLSSIKQPSLGVGVIYKSFSLSIYISFLLTSYDLMYSRWVMESSFILYFVDFKTVQIPGGPPPFPRVISYCCHFFHRLKKDRPPALPLPSPIAMDLQIIHSFMNLKKAIS